MKRFRIYQIIIDGAAGWIARFPEDFRQEIVTDCLEIFNYKISNFELQDMFSKISKLDLYEKIKFKHGYFEFYCFEATKEEFLERKKEFER